MEIPQSPVCFICENRFSWATDDIESMVQMESTPERWRAAAPAGSVCALDSGEPAVLICRTCKPFAGVVFGYKPLDQKPVNPVLEMKVGSGKTRSLIETRPGRLLMQTAGAGKSRT